MSLRRKGSVMSYSSDHPTRNLSSSLHYSCGRDAFGSSGNLEVTVSFKGRTLAVKPASQFRGRNAAQRCAELFSRVELADAQGRRVASRIGQRGNSYRAAYKASRAAYFRSAGMSEACVRWIQSVLSQAVSMDAAHAR